MTPLFTDIVVIGIVFLSGYLATIRGFTREFFAIMQWFLALMGAFMLAPYIAPFMELIPIIGEFLQECQMSMIAGFIFGFSISLAIIWFIFRSIASKVSLEKLRPIDQGLGFVFGAFRGIFFVVLCYMLYSLFVPVVDQPPYVADAGIVDFLRTTSDNLIAAIPDEMPVWLQARIDGLMGNCVTVPSVTYEPGV